VSEIMFAVSLSLCQIRVVVRVGNPLEA
jgi:hypothetical protein